MPVPPAPSASSDATASSDGAVDGGAATSSGSGRRAAATTIVPPATASGAAPAQLVLDEQPRDRVAERGQQHHRPAERARRALPDRSTPNSSATPTIPITMPDERPAVRALGVVEAQREQRGEDRHARDEDRRQRRGDVVLAVGDEQERPDDLDERDDDHPPRPRPRRSPSTPRRAANDSRSSAPSAVRRQTIAPSEKSSSATLMNMYDDPHTAAVATSMSQERRVIGRSEATGAPRRRASRVAGSGDKPG